MVDFSKVRIGDIGSVITGRTPKTDISDNYGGDFMFLGPSDLHKHFIITSSEKTITGQGLKSIESATIDGLSICTGCIGWDMGNVALVRGKCATNQQVNSITNIKGDYNPYFIYYWLKGKKDFLFQQANVTRTPILNKTDFSNIEIRVPSKSRQDSIAGFLKTIDKKIELNNKINAELETMAKLIYDYWFVQFDFPDADGKPYKSSGGKMIYNETLKREIPEGWGVALFGKYNTVKKGQLITKATVDVGEVKVVAAGIDYSYLHASSNYNKNTITISGSGASAGFVNFWREAIFASDCITVRGSDDANTILALQYLKLIQGYIFKQARGSAQPHVYPDDISKLNYLVPHKQLVEKYGNRVIPANDKIATNLKENERLAELRDWLLPMLMNGQVTVNS